MTRPEVIRGYMSKVGRVNLLDGQRLAVGESAADDGGDEDEFGKGGEGIWEAEGWSGSWGGWGRVREEDLRVRGMRTGEERRRGYRVGCRGNGGGRG